MTAARKAADEAIQQNVLAELKWDAAYLDIDDQGEALCVRGDAAPRERGEASCP